jgi:hypothetical protein
MFGDLYEPGLIGGIRGAALGHHRDGRHNAKLSGNSFCSTTSGSLLAAMAVFGTDTDTVAWHGRTWGETTSKFTFSVNVVSIKKFFLLEFFYLRFFTGGNMDNLTTTDTLLFGTGNKKSFLLEFFYLSFFTGAKSLKRNPRDS